MFHEDESTDISEIQNKDRSQLIKEITEQSHGGGNTFISDCPMEEL